MPKAGIPDSQRAALCKFFQEESEKRKVAQIQCATWFYEKYGHAIRQSTVSESLTSKWAYLEDTGSLSLLFLMQI